MAKGINPLLEMNSNQLVEKAKIAIRECGLFSLGFLNLSQPDIDLAEVGKLFELGLDFVELLCPACNGIHYVFTNGAINLKSGDTCLCHECANILGLMVFLKISEWKIKDWLQSKGKINPLEILAVHTSGVWLL